MAARTLYVRLSDSGGPVDLQIVGNALRNNIVARIEKGPSTPREKENCVCQFALRQTHNTSLTPALRSKVVKGRNYLFISKLAALETRRIRFSIFSIPLVSIEFNYFTKSLAAAEDYQRTPKFISIIIC
jgi:hypothetical protein